MVACRLTKDNNLFVDNRYNDEYLYPGLIDETNIGLSLSDQEYIYDQGIFTCKFRRDIKNDLYPEKIFDLNNAFIVFLAKGPLDRNGKD